MREQPAHGVDAPNPALWAKAGGTAQQLTLPVRSYNRLRLYLIPPFLRADRNSACNIKLQYPRRIRFAPLLVVSCVLKEVAVPVSHRAACCVPSRGLIPFP